MRTTNRIIIGVLVGLTFAAGYAARLKCTANERIVARQRSSVSVLSRGTSIASLSLEGAGNIDFRPVETLYSVLKNLREHYVDQLTSKDEGKMTYDAMKAMLSWFNDPNTRFVEPEQRRIIEDSLEGKFHGIGVVLGIKQIKVDGITNEHLLVITPIASGPAAAAGLRTGDDIVAIDGRAVLPTDPYKKANKVVNEFRENRDKNSNTQTELKKYLDAEGKKIEAGITIPDAESLLISQDKKSMELTVARKGEAKQLKIKITPREFTVDPVTASVIDNGKYGHVRINCLCQTTGRKFWEAIEDLKSREVRGMVIDLRNLAGGDVEAAIDVARRFAPEKTFAVLVKSRNRRSTLPIPAATVEEMWSKPVVVLVNRGTSRVPEVLASALKDNGGAKLVGQRTYGDFGYSTLIGQRDGSAVMMTTGMFLTSQSKNYSGKGLPVDVEVTAGSAGDAQLSEAVKLLGSAGGKS